MGAVNMREYMWRVGFYFIFFNRGCGEVKGVEILEGSGRVLV